MTAHSPMGLPPPAAVSGGQFVAHGPLHADLAGIVSLPHVYSVIPFASTSVGPRLVVLTVTPAINIGFAGSCADATAHGDKATTEAATISALKRVFMSCSSNGW